MTASRRTCPIFPTLVRATLALVVGLPLPGLAGAALPAFDARVAAGPSLDDLAAYAASTNPALRSARFGADAAAGASRASGWWPDPRLSLEKNLDTGMWKTTLTQGIPLPGATGAASDAAAAEARAAAHRLTRAGRETRLAVEESFWELHYLRRARGLAERTRQILAQALPAGATALATGRGSLSGLLRASSQAAQTDYDALVLGEREAAETARLNSLLDRPADAPVGPLVLPAFFSVSIPDLAFSAQEAERLALAGRAEALEAAEGAKRAEALAAVAAYDNLPGLELGASWEKGGDRSAMASVTLPLWLGRNAGRSAAARAGALGAAAELDGVLAQTRALASSLYFEARNARRLLALYRDTLLPQAALAADGAQARYRGEGEGLPDLLETVVAAYGAHLAAARAEADLGKAAARLAALTGRPALTQVSGGPAGPSESAPATAGTAFAAALARWQGALAGAAPAGAGSTFASPAVAGSPFFTADPGLVARLSDAAGRDAAVLLPDEFTLEELETAVFTRSPRIEAARRGFSAALQAFGQGESLDQSLLAISALTGETRPSAPGPIALKAGAAETEARLAWLDYQVAVRTELTRARSLYWELLHHRRSRALVEGAARALARIEESALARYSAGAGALQDSASASYERRQADLAAESLLRARTALASSFRELLGAAGGSVGVPAQREPDRRVPALADLESLARARRQELLRARTEAERAALMLELARREERPGLRLAEPAPGLSAPGLPPGLPPGLTDSFVRELELRLQEKKQQAAAEESRAAALAGEAWAALDRAAREEAFYGGAGNDLAALAWESALPAYESGGARLAEALAGWRRWFDNATAREEKRAELGTARARAEEAVGARLP